MADGDQPQPAPTEAIPPSSILAPPAPKPGIPWMLIGGIALAAWWWDKKFGKKGVLSAVADSVLGRDDDDDEEDDESDSDSSIEWTDEPIKKSRRRKRLADVGDVGGPITDTYIQPIKLAAQGHCREAVKLLDQQSKAGDDLSGRKKTVVRRALRRSATIVTEKCGKEVVDFVEARREWDESVEDDVEHLKVKAPASARAFVVTRDDVKLPGPKGARSFNPREGTPVYRTRGEAGRFKRKRGTEATEWRRKGSHAWRVLDLHTGTVTEKNVPTGKKRGRPPKLK